VEKGKGKGNCINLPLSEDKDSHFPVQSPNQ